jgi:PAS domain S-box-containing protein
MPVPLQEALERLGPRACAALFYRVAEDWVGASSAWLRFGLARGEKCVVHGRGTFGAEVLAALQARGTDVGNAMSRRSLLVLQADAAGGAAALLSRFEELCRSASAERFAGMRLCVDVSPAPGEGESAAGEAVDLAAELRAFAVSRDLQGLFLYREDGFPPATLNGLLRAHPYVLSGGKLIENYLYTAPGAPSTADGGRAEFSQALSRLEERHEQVARIRRQAIRLGRLRDITSSLLTKPSSPDLLNAVTDSLTALGYRMCWAGMARPDGSVEPVAVSGDLGEYLKSITVRWDEDPLGRGPTGTAIRTGRPDIVHDVRRSPRFSPWKESALARGFLSVAAVPLREEGKVAGALTVYAPAPNAFGAEAVEELAAFAQQASLVLERARDYRELARSEDRLRRLFEQIPAACFTFDRDGVVQQWNLHCRRLYGLSPPEAAGRFLYDIVLPPERREEAVGMVARVFAGESLSNMEWEVPGRGTGTRRVLTNLYPFRGSHGVVELGICMGVDVTERILLEEERERIRRETARAQKMEAVGSLAGGMAHEFNNVLETIIGHCSLLQAKMDRSHPFAETVHAIQSSAERAADLTAKLLGFGRGGKFRVQPVSLNRLAEHVLSAFASACDPSIRVENRLDPGLFVVEGDEGQLDQTLLNLCWNARDAMPAGGVLTLTTGNAVLDAEEAKRYHVGGPGRYAYVEVRDTGAGMTDEVQKHIFDPFYTTRRDRGRAGMGLPMAYGIVKNHSGGIHVESSPGEGSLFRIYLPAIARHAAVAPGAAGDPYPKGTETVLLVDDEPALREMAESMLCALGYRTFVAGDGEAACRLFREHAGEIALVILDIIMPKMGGREAFREMRRMKPGIPVLLSSGYSVEGLVQEILSEGANGFLPKPYGLSQVARAIRRVLSPEGVS